MSINWFRLSLISTVLSLGALPAIDCNPFGIKDLRGNSAAILGLSIGLFISVSLITLVLQTIRRLASDPTLPRTLLIGIGWLFFYVWSISHLSNTYCH